MKKRGWNIGWATVPWSLWGFVAILGINLVVILAHSIPIKLAVFSVVLLSAWAYFLLRGVRWLWIATAIYLGLFLAIDLATASGTWLDYAAGLVQLLLLVLPATRRFFARASPAADTLARG